jgi:hypothetical protein
MMARFTNRNHPRVHEISWKPAHGPNSTKPALYQSGTTPLIAVGRSEQYRMPGDTEPSSAGPPNPSKLPDYAPLLECGV